MTTPFIHEFISGFFIYFMATLIGAIIGSIFFLLVKPRWARPLRISLYCSFSTIILSIFLHKTPLYLSSILCFGCYFGFYYYIYKRLLERFCRRFWQLPFISKTA
jgi:predicted membrane channel-forming protein YqfA (hemolysin III family)